MYELQSVELLRLLLVSSGGWKGVHSEKARSDPARLPLFRRMELSSSSSIAALPTKHSPTPFVTRISLTPARCHNL